MRDPWERRVVGGGRRRWWRSWSDGKRGLRGPEDGLKGRGGGLPDYNSGRRHGQTSRPDLDSRPCLPDDLRLFPDPCVRGVWHDSDGLGLGLPDEDPRWRPPLQLLPNLRLRFQDWVEVSHGHLLGNLDTGSHRGTGEGCNHDFCVPVLTLPPRGLYANDFWGQWCRKTDPPERFGTTTTPNIGAGGGQVQR